MYNIMTNLIHLQNALNKVITDVRQSTLEEFVSHIVENDINLEEKEALEVKALVKDFVKNNTSNVFTFIPKKKEKKSRPPNSYNLFIKDKMREIKEANPEFKGKELMKRATEAWNQLKTESQGTNTDVTANN